jgi:excisionase family DNA binding protein
MLTIELQLVSNGRRLSLDDVADLVAAKAAQRVALEIKGRLVQPQPNAAWSSEPRLVGIAEATKLLGVGRSTIWKLIAEKRIETVQLGSRRMITATLQC